MLSLTIDETKIRERLATVGELRYVVTISNLDAESRPFPAPSVGGTMFGAPPVITDTREYVVSLRRKIEESGVPLKSTDELNREIDEMRGRGH
jgi:hypothetical protein